MRLTRKRLKEMHEDEYRSLRLRVEMDLYPQVIEDYVAANGSIVLDEETGLVVNQ